jgi:hypothetical protein
LLVEDRMLYVLNNFKNRWHSFLVFPSPSLEGPGARRPGSGGGSRPPAGERSVPEAMTEQ